MSFDDTVSDIKRYGLCQFPLAMFSDTCLKRYFTPNQLLGTISITTSAALEFSAVLQGGRK